MHDKPRSTLSEEGDHIKGAYQPQEEKEVEVPASMLGPEEDIHPAGDYGGRGHGDRFQVGS